jgi:diaminopimelate epimerase
MPEASPFHFRKMNGLGNDFVVFDARKRSLAMDEAKARAIADELLRRAGGNTDPSTAD